METAAHVLIIQLALMSCLCSIGASTITSPFQIGPTCNNAGTITGQLKSGIQVDHTVCGTVKKDGGSTTFNITGCAMGQNATLYLYSGTLDGKQTKILKTGNSKVYKIVLNCNYDGFTGGKGSVKAVASFSIQEENSYIPMKTVPSVTMQVTTTENKTLTTATIGGQYHLIINGPADLYLYVDTCEASKDGQFTGTEVITIYPDTDPIYGILPTFSGTQGSLLATLSGFRFIDSDTVYLQCNVNLCVSQPCPARKKRKRINSGNNKKVTLTTSFKVQGQNAEANGSRGCYARWETLVIAVLALLFVNVVYGQ